MNPNYVDFYLQRIDINTTPISFFKNLTPQKLDSFLITNNDNDFLVCGNISRKIFPIIKQYYPFIVDKDYGFTYEHYIFSKDTINQKIEEAFQNIRFEFNDSLSHNNAIINEQDLHFSKKKLIPPNKKIDLLRSKLKHVVKDVHFFIDLHVEIQSQNNLTGHLISDIILNDNTIKRYSLNLSKPTLNLNQSALKSFFLPIRLTSAKLDSKMLENLIIKISLDNKRNESSIIVDNLQVETFAGNKFVYSLVQDF